MYSISGRMIRKLVENEENKLIEHEEDKEDLVEEDEDFTEEDDVDEEYEDEDDDEETHHHSEITGVLIDVLTENKASVRTIKNELDGYYEILECDCFDIVSVTIGNHRYDVYCDDEALLKDNPIVSAIDHSFAPMLTNNLFVTLTDENGETISLSEENIKEVMDNIKGLFDLTMGTSRPVLICKY